MPESELAFTRYFAVVPDPRANRTKKHALIDILGVTLCAVICGADSSEEIERFGDARESWLEEYFPLANGIPSHDTFNRVLAARDRNVFAACFGQWMADPNTATGLEAIAIDGKSGRAAPGDTFSGCLHLVSAWATEHGLIPGREAVPEGGHEITTIPALLRALDLKGAAVTIDAAGCQKAIVGQIRDRGGDYVVAVKGNQPGLHRACVAALAKAGETASADCDMSASAGDAHGRREERYATVIRDPEGLPSGRADVAAVVVVGRERGVKGANASTCHFYPTSLRASAAALGGYIRGHWGVENGLHWCLDVAFREDENRTRDTNAGANFGVVRRVAASLLKQDKGKGGIKAKRLNAAWNPDYLKQVLQGFQAN